MEVCAPNQRPAWLPPSQPGGAPGAACEGQEWVCSAGLGAGVKDPGWVVGGEEGTGVMLPPRQGWESPSSRLCQRGAGKQSPFFSTLLPALLVPAPKGEGRKEGEQPSWHSSHPEPGCKPTCLPGKDPAQVLGRENKQIASTHPSEHCAPHPGACGTWTLQRV